MARRCLLSALAASIALLLAASDAGAAVEQAREADRFVDSIGVNVHTSYSDTPYTSHFDGVKQKLVELGLRNVRDGLEPNRPDQYQRLNELAALGVRPTLILGDPNRGDANLDELLSTLRSQLANTVAAVEGPNEFDMAGRADWISALTAYQQRLYAAIKSDPSLSGLPVVGPSLVQRSNQKALGDISSALDYGNIHSYPDGHSPEANLSDQISRAALNSGSKPVMATETGYHTALGWGGEHDPVSEQAMATYIPRMYLEYFRRGIVRTFSYELLDEGLDAGAREDNFGLLRNDLSEKPAFAALRNTIEILEDPGPTFAPSALAYSLRGEGDGVQSLLLQKRDGAFYLALWRATAVWNPQSQAALAPSGGSVTVDFGRPLTSAAAYAPNVAARPVASLPVGGNTLSVELGAQAVILRVAVGPKPKRIKLWVSRRSVPAGGRIGVRGRLPSSAAGRSLRVKIQRRRAGAWRTVGHGRATRAGVFRKAIRLSPARFGRTPKLRVIARKAKPSRAVRVQIRGSGKGPKPVYRARRTGRVTASR